jgi:hypothetical protein
VVTSLLYSEQIHSTSSWNDSLNQVSNFKQREINSPQQVSYLRDCDSAIMEPTITLEKSTFYTIMSFMLLSSTLFATFVTPSMLGMPLKLLVILVVFNLPLGGLFVFMGALVCSMFAGESGVEFMQSMSDRHHTQSDDPEKAVRAAVIEEMASQQVKIAASRSSRKTSVREKQELCTKSSQSDTSDDASTIFTPLGSEVSTTSIMEDLENACQEKKDLEAAENDEEYDRQMAQLDMEEAKFRYESTSKYSDERAAALIALDNSRRACAALEYAKKRKVFKLKKVNLEIEYLEKRKEETK